MGNCIHKKNGTSQACVPMQLQYSRQGYIKVKNKKSSVPNSVIEVAFHLSEPLKVMSDELNFINSLFYISLSVLPGIDPRKDLEKVSQDNCFYVYSSTSLLMGLFDGHGVFGALVTKFCCDLCESLFTRLPQYVSCIQSDPSEYLRYLTSECEQGLKSSEIDASLSGW